MILIECVPPLVAKYITEQLNIPTIGIGAGPHCSAQIQIFHDVVGIFDMFKPGFSKQYVDVGSQIENAIHEYVGDVRNQEFPNASQCYSIKEEQYKKFVELAENHLSNDEEEVFNDLPHVSQLNGTNGTNGVNGVNGVNRVNGQTPYEHHRQEVFHQNGTEEISWSRPEFEQESSLRPQKSSSVVSSPVNSSPRRSSQKNVIWK
eukprot:TRINITY_DN5625_c0_g1_i1.p1 TRINITY_DN5625_c0_g1~~TRINITY_DN5625_c0_g1_i1.p1  ORF type:complete len:204 (-),score=34.33 TRINITY_DN5625_c0_g1_i1:169-780(-)